MVTANARTARVDVYSTITNRIIEQLEAGTRPWLKLWHAEHAAGRVTRPLRHGGQPYSGINVITLWMTAESSGFISPYFLTYRQAQELGGHVKKGEHGVPAVYASTFKKKEQTAEGDEVEQAIPFLKEYSVFCADQCEGLPAQFYQFAEPPKETMERIVQAERLFANPKAEIRTGGNKAHYTMDDDYVKLPSFETFRDAESHAATLAHELTHWTRHPTRLNRELGRKRFGDEGHAVQEPVAEIGSAFLCADLQITPEVREDHAGYVGSWLKVLKYDKRAIFIAASHASKAVELLHGLQPIAAD